MILNEKEPSVWNTVTPFSKYLAMTLFVALPFIGGWVGYTYPPEKVTEVEKIVEVEKPEATQEDDDMFHPGNFKYLDSYYISFIEDKIYLSKIVFGGLETLQEIDWDRALVRNLDSNTKQFITEYDINYDAFKDLGVPVNTRKNQVLYEFYVFDHESERLIKVTDFEGPGPAANFLTNPTFDVASKTITSEFHTKDEIIFTQYKFNGSEYVTEKTWSDNEKTSAVDELTNEFDVHVSSNYRVLEYQCPDSWMTCYRLQEKVSEKDVVENLNTTFNNQGLEEERIHLLGYLYTSDVLNRVYFLTGVPDSDACCNMVYYDVSSNSFAEVAEYEIGLSDITETGYLIVADERGKYFTVYDLDTEKEVKTVQLDEGTLIEFPCGMFASSMDIEVKNGHKVVYGLHQPTSETGCQKEICKEESSKPCDQYPLIRYESVLLPER